jgi:ribonuclease Z
MRRIFRYLEPTFFSGLIDDPCLVVRDRPIHQGIMIDCGAIHHLAKRELKPVRAIFVSHAHMDHFMGFDTFVRQTHASPRTVELFGPPGFADRVAARLSGYDWNLAERYWCTFMVHEVHAESLVSFRFSGPERFRRSHEGESPRQGAVIYRHNHLEVAAELLDHGIPVLAFRVREQKLFSIDGRKMSALGLVAGNWLRELKRRFFADWPETGELQVLRGHGNGVREEAVSDAAGLYREICGENFPASIGYLTDVGFSAENRAAVERFLAGVTLLVGECAFLREDLHKARSSHHLCTDDVNALLDVLRPSLFLPMHLSKTYLGRSRELYAELVPPPGTILLHLPEHLTPRPLYSFEALQLGKSRSALRLRM